MTLFRAPTDEKRRSLWLGLIAIGCVAVTACGPNTSTTSPIISSGPTTPSAAPTLPTSATGADLQFCVDETNRYRAGISKPPLARSFDLEVIANTAARVDGTAHAGHSYSQSIPTRTWAENELPWWPLAQFVTVHAVLEAGIAGMWAEGPSGGHYQNIVSNVAGLGCGVFINGGEITVAQDFR